MINRFIKINSVINTLFDLRQILLYSERYQFVQWNINNKEYIVLYTNIGKFLINLPIIQNIKEYNIIFMFNNNYYIKHRYNTYLNKWFLHNNQKYALISNHNLNDFLNQLENYSTKIYNEFKEKFTKQFKDSLNKCYE